MKRACNLWVAAQRDTLAGAVAARAAQFEVRIKKLPGIASGKNVTVTLDGQTAILAGKVATAHERDLIARLAMLEPGIAAVQNQLEVFPDLSTPEVVPTPAPK